MLSRAIDSLIPDYKKLKNRTVFICLLALSFFLRFPFVFRDYIDRDESTFILVAQGWVDGHLPYTLLWDLKPPITFAFFASMILLFGKSLIAIRISGIVVVALIAFFSYWISCEFSNKKTAFWVGVFTVLLISLFGSLQGVMSEHISMLFFMPALYLIITRRKTLSLFLAGLLFGGAIMTKINLAYPVLLLGLYLIYEWIRSSRNTKGIVEILAFALGVVIIILLTALPYYLESNTILWWKAVVLAPLEYSGARRDSLVSFAPLLIPLGVFLIYAIRTGRLNLKNTGIVALLVALVGVVIAFISGGRINGHYLIQLHPILLILLGIVLGNALTAINWNYRPLVLIILLLLPIETYKEYRDIIRNKLETGYFINGEGYTVSEYIKEQSLPTTNILFLEYHIGYWFLDLVPPTKAATHPTNICRDETFVYFDNPRDSSMEELRYIMEDIAPEIVITRKKWNIFDKKEEEENIYIRNFLQEHYNIRKEIDNSEIHQRLKIQ